MCLELSASVLSRTKKAVAVYPKIGKKPKVAKEANMTKARRSVRSDSSGTLSPSSSVIMRLMKNSGYLAIRLITSSASGLDMPRFTKISTISEISPSGWFLNSHASRERSSAMYSFSDLVERYSPTPIASASASTLEIPIPSTALTPRPTPAAPATIAKDVRIPSSPPNTTNFTYSPPCWCGSSLSPCVPPPPLAACATALAPGSPRA
mmetsp:Transcript_5803/g.15138  ORF Transcript_5803/g.15138 Transcript_5803/m.15138 type:complete len:208 (+) Transcript_5803:416-1039(+)